MMTKKYNFLGSIAMLILSAFVLAACTAANPPAGDVKDTHKAAESLEMGNNYLAVTDQLGTLDDGKFFAAGFLGYYKNEAFQKAANDYGYRHLSRVPEWVDAGGSEAWIIVPKYKNSEIVVTALKDIKLSDGKEIKAGTQIKRAEESLVLYADSKDQQPSVEVTVVSGTDRQTFTPITQKETGAVSLPDYIWDVSEYELTNKDEDLLGLWQWKSNDGWIQYIEITEGSTENGAEGAYFAVIESLYPGADPGLGGPFGYTLAVDGERAVLSTAISEGSLSSEIELTQDGEQLTVKWVGGDRCFSLKELNDTIVFNRVSQ